MLSRDSMKEEFKRWIKKNEGMSPSRVLIAMSRANKYSDEELESLTLDDMGRVVDDVVGEMLNAERFEHISLLVDVLNDLKKSYEEGITLLPTFNAQCDHHIKKFLELYPRKDKCSVCGQGHTGTMQFICDNCKKFT